MMPTAKATMVSATVTAAPWMSAGDVSADRKTWGSNRTRAQVSAGGGARGRRQRLRLTVPYSSTSSVAGSI